MLETNRNDVVLQMLATILDCNFTCTTYICQDANSLILMTLLKSFVDFGVRPHILKNGTNFILLEIPELGLRFLNSNNYLAGNEYELAAFFEIKTDRIYFPFKFLKFENLHYCGKIPSFKYFESFEDDEKTLKQKREFFTKMEAQACNWDLSKELLAACDQKLMLLAKSMLSFLNY